jgi:hypothetical protein
MDEPSHPLLSSSLLLQSILSSNVVSAQGIGHLDTDRPLIGEKIGASVLSARCFRVYRKTRLRGLQAVVFGGFSTGI